MKLNYILYCLSVLWLLPAIGYAQTDKGMVEDDCGTVVTAAQLSYMQKTRAARSAIDPEVYRQLKATRDIPVQVHIIRTDNGSGGFDLDDLADEFAIVNDLYSPNNMLFYYGCNPINYIDDSDLRSVKKGSSEITNLVANHNIDDVINIYFTREVLDAENDAICGYATFPSSLPRDEIIIANDCANNGSTLAHELGHYFNLYHTHETATGEENVTRNHSNSCCNCLIAGDELCDTPADPRLSTGSSPNVSSGSCTYTGSAEDDCDVDYTPDARNLMSYSYKHCRTHLSSGQLNRILQSYLYDRDYLADGVCCPFTERLYHNAAHNVGAGEVVSVETVFWIEAFNRVSTGGVLTCEAGEYITLFQGFEVENNAIFNARIDECDDARSTTTSSTAPAPTQPSPPTIATQTTRQDLILTRSYPNPFSGQTTIEYTLPDLATVTLSVHDLTGRELIRLVNRKHQLAGRYSAVLNGSHLPVGMYYYVLRTNDHTTIEKLIRTW